MHPRRLIVILLCLTLLSTSALWAAEEQDATPGYDENTEVKIKGTILDLPQQPRGPVILRVKSATKTHQVMTGPRWYLLQEGIVFKSGENITVTGSKFTGRDGSVYVIAKRIQNTDTGKEHIFRDMTCNPLWTGHGRGKGRMGR
jgi:hypothetical protein